MLKVVVLFVFMICSQSTEANDNKWDQCLEGLESKLNKYEESLNQMVDPNQMSVLYNNELERQATTTGAPGTTSLIQGLQQLLDGLVGGLITLLEKLQTSLTGTTSTLLSLHGSKRNLVAENLLGMMMKEQIKVYRPFIQANEKVLDLVNKLKNSVGA